MPGRERRGGGWERTVTALTGEPTTDDGQLPERYHPLVQPSGEIERRDLRRVLDDELLRLPEKYRAPVVLCDLEGHTREEAARQLGWPTGSMSRRLDRARSLLRRRLTHRGVALAIVGVASIAIAAGGIGLRTDRSLPSSSVRNVMAPFKPESEGGRDYGAILAAAARIRADQSDFARILPAAREAALAARRIQGRARGPLAALWNRYAAEMNRSATDLERACRDSDGAALIAAARRLDASCMSCHAVFRAEPAHAGLPASDRIPFGLPPGITSLRPVPTARSLTLAARRGSPPGPDWRAARIPFLLRPPTSGANVLPAAQRSEAERFTIPASNEWAGAIVKIDGAFCSVIAPTCGRFPRDTSGDDEETGRQRAYRLEYRG